MNILPKKRWHVRNRENIARVRRDEAQAAQEDRDRQERIKLAEREARRKLLLEKSRKSISQKQLSVDSQCTSDRARETHINFFQELEEGTAEFNKSNKAHDKEVKEEREKYEKQIGYLTYLGQDTNEALGKKNWYDVVPERSNSNIEINLKSKVREDPLQIMNRYATIGKLIDESERKSAKLVEYKPILNKINNSSKRRRKYSSSSDGDRTMYKTSNNAKKKSHKKKEPSSPESTTEDSEDEEKLAKQKMLEKLRIERLKREREERRKTEELLATLKGRNNTKDIEKITFRPKYNSQFNPQLAKQNYNR